MGRALRETHHETQATTDAIAANSLPPRRRNLEWRYPSASGQDKLMGFARAQPILGTIAPSSWPGLTRPSTSYLLSSATGRGCPGHLARRRASRFSPGMTSFDKSAVLLATFRVRLCGL